MLQLPVRRLALVTVAAAAAALPFSASAAHKKPLVCPKKTAKHAGKCLPFVKEGFYATADGRIKAEVNVTSTFMYWTQGAVFPLPGCPTDDPTGELGFAKDPGGFQFPAVSDPKDPFKELWAPSTITATKIFMYGGTYSAAGIDYGRGVSAAVHAKFRTTTTFSGSMSFTDVRSQGTTDPLPVTQTCKRTVTFSMHRLANQKQPSPSAPGFG